MADDFTSDQNPLKRALLAAQLGTNPFSVPSGNLPAGMPGSATAASPVAPPAPPIQQAPPDSSIPVSDREKQLEAQYNELQNPTPSAHPLRDKILQYAKLAAPVALGAVAGGPIGAMAGLEATAGGIVRQRDINREQANFLQQEIDKQQQMGLTAKDVAARLADTRAWHEQLQGRNRNESPADRASAAAQFGLKPGDPGYTEFVLTGTLPTQKPTTAKTDTPEGRASTAAAYGLKPGDPAYTQFILTGTMPVAKTPPADRTIQTANGVMMWNPATEKYDIKAGDLPRPPQEPGTPIPIYDPKNPTQVLGAWNPKTNQMVNAPALPGTTAQGIAAEQKANKPPSADEIRRADLANNMSENLNKLEEIVNRRPDLFGPYAGRVTSIKQALGTSDPDVAALQAIHEYFGMASVGTHSMRNAQHVGAAADAVFNSYKNSPDAVKNAINTARDSLSTFVKDVQGQSIRTQAPVATGGVATHRFNPATGKIEPK